jgi:hypothetical protein
VRGASAALSLFVLYRSPSCGLDIASEAVADVCTEAKRRAVHEGTPAAELSDGYRTPLLGLCSLPFPSMVEFT